MVKVGSGEGETMAEAGGDEGEVEVAMGRIGGDSGHGWISGGGGDDCQWWLCEEREKRPNKGVF